MVETEEARMDWQIAGQAKPGSLIEALHFFVAERASERGQVEAVIVIVIAGPLSSLY